MCRRWKAVSSPLLEALVAKVPLEWGHYRIVQEAGPRGEGWALQAVSSLLLVQEFYLSLHPWKTPTHTGKLPQTLEGVH